MFHAALEPLSTRRLWPLALSLASLVILAAPVRAGSEDDENDRSDTPVMVTGTWLADPAARRGVPALNVNIVRFARANLNRKVGSGQCTAVVEAAYRRYGAEMPPKSGSNVDYDWGTLVDIIRPGERPSSRIEPGDILQFRDARFAGRTPRGTYTKTTTHHTAIVVGKSGSRLYVLHQNSNGNQTVQGATYDFADLKRGWARAYRPVAKRAMIVTVEGGASARRITKGRYVVHSVRARAGQRVTVRTSGARADLDLYVYGPHKRRIGVDRDSDANPSFSWRARSTGTYKVIVKNAGKRTTAYRFWANAR